jgi:hypothetical protein
MKCYVQINYKNSLKLSMCNILYKATATNMVTMWNIVVCLTLTYSYLTTTGFNITFLLQKCNILGQKQLIPVTNTYIQHTNS